MRFNIVSMNIHSFRRVHCVGIGGIGVSAIARFFVHSGARVSGTDVAHSSLIDVLRAEGIEVSIGHGADLSDVDLLVYSPAVPDDNPERVDARDRGIPHMSYPEVLGALSRTRPTFAVTGMHGKSTTTAMLGLIFVEAGLDPLVIVGSQVPQFEGKNIRLSARADSPFIVEACEYRGHMNQLSPHCIVITNIEEEHLDYYRDIEHIRETFAQFVHHLPADGVLVRHDRDATLNPLVCSAREIDVDSALVDVLGIRLRVPGEHNQYNAALALAAARAWGISDDVIVRALSSYRGIWRRFEVVGSYGDVEVISDYGHHPTEIAATLQAARDTYIGKKLLLVFQPHQYDRTKKLFDGFVRVLREWDGVVVSDVYDVVGREEVRDVGSRELYEALQGEHVWYGGGLEETEHIARQLAAQFDVVVVMGAGTIDRVARSMAAIENV